MTHATELSGRRRGTGKQQLWGKSSLFASAGSLILLIASPIVFGSVSHSQTVEGNRAGNGQSSSSIESVLSRARSASLTRRYSEAIRVLRTALKEHPAEISVQMELGRAYLATGEDNKAERLFRQILRRVGHDREAELELARTLAYSEQYDESDRLYRGLLASNPADEAASIGLTSNLIHENQRANAGAVADAALVHHPNSLRLLEYKDRIASGLLGGDERTLPPLENVFSAATEYVNDSAGNHSWRESERVALNLKHGLATEFHLEQQVLHSLDDPLETVASFSQVVRWKPFERLALTADGGAIRFDKNGDVHPIYEGSLAGLFARHWLAGAKFSRIPIVPDAEAAEHRLTAQGWEVFSLWAPTHWQIDLHASRRHYSDENVGSRESAEVLHQWNARRASYTAGYQFRHYGFSMDVAHGYFSPDDYQSHQAEIGATFRPTRWFRIELTGGAGAESIASGADFQPAWEITARSKLHMRHWDLSLDYSRFDMAQVSGAFTADAARFEFAYRF